MNPQATQDKKAGKAIGKRGMLMVLGVVSCTLSLHGQQLLSSADGSAGSVPNADVSTEPADQSIPSAVMNVLELNIAIDARYGRPH